MLDGVLEQGVQRDPEPLGVAEEPFRGEGTEAPAPRRDLRPSHEDVLEERLDVDRLGRGEAGVICFCEEQEAFEDSLHPLQLIQRDVELGLRLGEPEPIELQMPTRDCDGRPQLV